MFVCSQSCLVPQRVDELVTSPHPAPHFVVETIPSYLVGVLQLVRQGSLDQNCHCELQIPPLFVEEDDPTVDLEVRWFIDYNLSVPRTQAPWPGSTFPLPGTFKDATATVRQTNGFNFDADADAITSNGIHLLEVVVGETAAFDDSATAALPNRTPKPGFTLAVYRFPINVDVQQDVPHCPLQLPSVQVCQ
ncbi:MAG TPA: hypothetical protein VLW85_02420 [Myxococcales bacterium]|nr:hypothetical protein [Myxococcales bacterium]